MLPRTILILALFLIPTLSSAASQNELAKAEELFLQGEKYRTADGVAGDYTIAFDYYLKAAELGYEPAQVSVAEMYSAGAGVPSDSEQSFKWYKKSAEQGNKRSQFNVALMYDEGDGTERNHQKSFEWYKKSAEQGFSKSQNNLASIYYNNKDFKKAYTWYLKAAQQGHTKAQYSLGWMLFNGEHKKNSQEAYTWFMKAAQKGHAYAQFSVGWMLYHGEGTKQDMAEGERWLIKASDNGNEAAKKELAQINSMEKAIYTAMADDLKKNRKTTKKTQPTSIELMTQDGDQLNFRATVNGEAFYITMKMRDMADGCIEFLFTEDSIPTTAHYAFYPKYNDLYLATKERVSVNGFKNAVGVSIRDYVSKNFQRR